MSASEVSPSEVSLDPRNQAISNWQADCEKIFEKVRQQLQQRDELCSRIVSGELALQTLLLEKDLSQAELETKLLTVLDSLPELGKVPARKILQERQSWRIGQFSKQELSDIVQQVAQAAGKKAAGGKALGGQKTTAQKATAQKTKGHEPNAQQTQPGTSAT